MFSYKVHVAYLLFFSSTRFLYHLATLRVPIKEKKPVNIEKPGNCSYTTDTDDTKLM